ncbi:MULTISPECIES: MFS transporter [Streptomyces]|uniref:MFS transporter n=1 Tax=Streptomyces glycanivorans TaxID=3033808 RepID=A0ABY9JQB9_9ACTN|nr:MULTISPECIES: MFS transporter [unclassified Streptomyces]WLQ68236.1 MFS transporter [Streptomyces sp. Alt3]WSQ81592.1 MFS transporter [Streptomyces sp. NBC_01213]WSR05077.1 MFS transporter [Streptomyces sp. NBC_01208]WSR52313.1 MFS transporter [Streptomyces sp. NBC_01201]
MSEPLAAPARTERGRSLLLMVLSGNMVLDAIEVSVVLVALPAIRADLGLTPWSVQWLMSGFALGFAAMLMSAPAISARWGLRNVYLAAMPVFAAASVIGGLSDSLALLIASRVVKGACAALTAPAGLALITATFPDGPRQRRALSVYSLFGAAGFTVGLLLAGVLVVDSWRWTFLFPAPVALVLLVCGLRVIPDSVRHARPRVTAAVLRNGPLMRATLGAATLNGTFIGLLLLFTLGTSGGFGWEPWQISLALLPACLPLALSVRFAGRVVGRFGAPRLIAAGSLSAFAGVALLLLLPEPDSYAAGPLPALLLVGIALQLSFAALNMQAAQSVGPALRAASMPVYQAGVQIGSALVLPLVGALLTVNGTGRPTLLALSLVGALGVAVAVAGPRALPPEERTV